MIKTKDDLFFLYLEEEKESDLRVSLDSIHTIIFIVVIVVAIVDILSIFDVAGVDADL